MQKDLQNQYYSSIKIGYQTFSSYFLLNKDSHVHFYTALKPTNFEFLLCWQHKMKSEVWTEGTSGLEGEFQSGSEVDFYTDKVIQPKGREKKRNLHM